MENKTAYCINTDCKNKYRCSIYSDIFDANIVNDFWFTKYNPKDCPSIDKLTENVSENKIDEIKTCI